MPRVITPGALAAAVRIRGVPTAAPARALATAVHQKVGITRAGPPEGGSWQIAPAAVPDELDHRRQRTVEASGRRQPRRDPITGVPAEGDVVHRDRAVGRVDLLARHLQVVSACLHQRAPPEVVEVVWFSDRRKVANELLEWQIRYGHSESSLLSIRTSPSTARPSAERHDRKRSARGGACLPGGRRRLGACPPR